MSLTRLLSTSVGAAAAGLAGGTALGDMNRRKSSLAQASEERRESEANLAQPTSNTLSLERVDSNSSALERIDSNASASDPRGSRTSEAKPPSATPSAVEQKPGALPSQFFHLKIGNFLDWKNGGKDH